MSPRGFVILLVVTVLAAIGAIVMAVQPATSDTDAVAGDPMFPALSQKLADAGEISVTTPQYTITWKRQGDGWVSPERGDYPAHKGTVSDLVSSLAHMTKVEAKTAEPDWSVSSNAPPSMRLRKFAPLNVASTICARSMLRPFE